MNKIEYLLTCLKEECSEVQMASSKSERFGFDSDYIGITNLTQLVNEFNDLLAVVDLLNEETEVNHRIVRNESLILAKKKKMEVMMNISRQLGKLDAETVH
tara:strand:- start:14 stop:316 length:303 start_codon:yes stop_codon:yes gene_type:complete